MEDKEYADNDISVLLYLFIFTEAKIMSPNLLAIIINFRFVFFVNCICYCVILSMSHLLFFFAGDKDSIVV